MAEPTRAFGPVVLLGLASGALAAVTATKAWVAMSGTSSSGTSGAISAAFTLPASFRNSMENVLGAIEISTIELWKALDEGHDRRSRTAP